MKMGLKFHKPFSPFILETEVPRKFIDIINNSGDLVLSDKQKTAHWDWSDNLVGKVSNEIQIPISKDKDKKYILDVLKNGCLEYLKYAIEDNRAYKWKEISKGETPTRENINVTQSWIVSQFKGEFNPFHHHNGDLSSVIYLKIPKGMNDEWKEEFKDHYPAKGLIEFRYGEVHEWICDNMKFFPEVGKWLIFPSWLKHFVYPFDSEGERRSMSFNAEIIRITE